MTEELVRELTMGAESMDAHLESILHLAFVAEFRDADTSQHLRRVSLVSRLVAQSVGLSDDEVEAIAMAAPMHDIGKVAIPDAILLKPGALTADERQTMQEHTLFGARLLVPGTTPILQAGEAICRTHHERWNGGGYPTGAKGDDIPLPGRLVGLVDVYDALVTRRVYKPPVPHEDAFATIRAESGSHFDPRLVEAFCAAHDQILAVYLDFGDEDEEADWVT